MTRNKLIDLNDHLFEQLERLNDDELTSEELGKEIDRTVGMSEMAKSIISVASLLLEVEKIKVDYGSRITKLPEPLESKPNKGKAKK